MDFHINLNIALPIAGFIFGYMWKAFWVWLDKETNN